MSRRLAAVLAALALTVLTTTAALAVTISLHQGTNVAWNDPSVDVECDASVGSGMVLWHFVAHTTTNDFTMSAAFGDGTVVTNLAPTSAVASYELQWNVTTTLTTLQAASITGSGSVNPGGFNLSHVCPNPGVEVPEAPASALLVATAGLLGLGLVGWKMRQRTEAA